MTTEKPDLTKELAPSILWSHTLRIVRLMLCVWPERHRQRARLRELEPDQLDDIGISRADAMREGRKPFWR